MSKYKIKVDFDCNFGIFELDGTNDFNVAKDKFKSVKEQFKDTPCTITLVNTELNTEIWAPTASLPTMADRWNAIIDAIYDFQAAALQTHKQSSEANKQINGKDNVDDMVHSLEQMNLSEMKPEDIISWVENKKSAVTIRRIVKSEQVKYASAQRAINELIEILSDTYKTNGYKRMNDPNYTVPGKYGQKRKYDLKDIEKLYL